MVITCSHLQALHRGLQRHRLLKPLRSFRLLVGSRLREFKFRTQWKARPQNLHPTQSPALCKGRLLWARDSRTAGTQPSLSRAPDIQKIFRGCGQNQQEIFPPSSGIAEPQKLKRVTLAQIKFHSTHQAQNSQRFNKTRQMRK